MLRLTEGLDLLQGRVGGGLLAQVDEQTMMASFILGADGTWPKVEALLAAPVARSARRPTPWALPPAPESRTRQKSRVSGPGCLTAP